MSAEGGGTDGCCRVVDRHSPQTRAWVAEAIRRVEADSNRSADTHLHVFPLPESWDVDLYLKDESVHPTGSLKHRLARSLFLYALCNGWIVEGTTIIEASSGSTAVSEAYFARLLGLPFVAVMPAATSREKIELIEFYGGRCHLVDDPGAIYAESRRLAQETGGHYLDQFTYAERATDWRGNNNIAESIFEQLALERHPVPRWVVVGAGTGGTSATIGRYLRYRGLATQLCVAEPVGGAFARGWQTRDRDVHATGATVIEGIGRRRVEAGFLFGVVDDVIEVPDPASIAAAWRLEALFGRRYGGSSGTNFVACLQLAARMRAHGERGSIVSLLCDRGERYDQTLFDPEWLERHGLDPVAWSSSLLATAREGRWHAPDGGPGIPLDARQCDAVAPA